MPTIVFQAHSGLRYLVLLAAVVALFMLRRSLKSEQPFSRGTRIAAGAFTGLLDLQVLLGIATAALRPFVPMYIGHIVMMVLALSAAHGFSISARRAGDERTRHIRALLGVAVPLLLILAGIAAIRRPIL